MQGMRGLAGRQIVGGIRIQAQGSSAANGGSGAQSIRVNVLDRTQHSAISAWRSIQGLEGRGGIILAIGGVRRVVRGIRIGWIEDGGCYTTVRSTTLGLGASA